MYAVAWIFTVVVLTIIALNYITVFGVTLLNVVIWCFAIGWGLKIILWILDKIFGPVS